MISEVGFRLLTVENVLYEEILRWLNSIKYFLFLMKYLLTINYYTSTITNHNLLDIITYAIKQKQNKKILHGVYLLNITINQRKVYNLTIRKKLRM